MRPESLRIFNTVNFTAASAATYTVTSEWIPPSLCSNTL
jgi:hypothetical protein